MQFYTFSDNKTKQNEWIKVLAVLFMVIDHAGKILFPEQEWLQWIGRLAFPMFAYQIATGYYHTSNHKKYMIRLWVFALISQIPYTLVFDTLNLNILFTFLISLTLIHFYKKKQYYWFPLLGLLIFILPFDYSWYGVLTPFFFYLFYQKKTISLGFQILILIAYVFSFKLPAYQLFAVAGTLISFYLPTNSFKIYLNKYFFYWFYPLHLFILFLLKMLLLQQ